MKKKVINLITFLLAAIYIAALIPNAITRVKNENGNKNVAISLQYINDKAALTADELDKYIDSAIDSGANTVSVNEEDLNTLANKGVITVLKYNVLCHKYDEESVNIADMLSENKNVSDNSYVVITRRDNVKEKLKRWIPNKYSQSEYSYYSTDGLDIYCIYDGSQPATNTTVGFDEDDLKYLASKNVDLAMVIKFGEHKTRKYLDDMDRLIKKYNVKYLSILDDKRKTGKDEQADKLEDVKGLSALIKNNGLTLIVNENDDQLSNKKPLGYNKIFRDNYSKTARGYEAYYIKDDPTYEEFRYYQYLNSVVDRNTKFLTITQVNIPGRTYVQGEDVNLKTIKLLKEKLTASGYKIGTVEPNFKNYKNDIRHTANFAAAAIILMCLFMLKTVLNKDIPVFSVICFVISGLAVIAGTKMPSSLMRLVPTLYAIVLPCFAITVLFSFIKRYADKFNTLILTLLSVIILVFIMCFGAVAQGAMLSGIEYYINNYIFRGIKVSLIVPVLYSIFIYYFIFIRGSERNVVQDITAAATAKISVYWLAIFFAFAGMAFMYLLRSGNVEKISTVESLMRKTITDVFIARPRTKEFLLGYPSLVLFVYYIKNTKSKVMPFLTAVGSSILAASVINSFCHVFTDLTTIYMRVINGIVIAAVVCIVVYVLNLAIVWLARKIIKENLKSETK